MFSGIADDCNDNHADEHFGPSQLFAGQFHHADQNLAHPCDAECRGNQYPDRRADAPDMPIGIREMLGLG